MKKLFTTLFFIFSSSLVVLEAQSYTITAFAGNGIAGSYGSGIKAINANLDYPSSVAVDHSGNVYIADYDNNRIRKVNTSGIISNFAGNGAQGYSGDGKLAILAEMSRPTGVAVDDSGNVYIADYANNRIRKVNTSGIISTFAGNGTAGYSGDGGMDTAAELNYPIGVTVDASGNIYITSCLSNCVRKVDTKGIISTFAGNGTAGYSGDGKQATSAELSGPYGVAVDASGNVYIADDANNCIREVNTNGIISTIAGNGTAGYSGDGTAAIGAELNQPQGISFDALGNMYITDYSNQCIRKVNTGGIISTFAGNGVRGYFGDGGMATTAELANPAGEVGIDALGDVYIADQGNQRIRKVATADAGINGLTSENENIKIYPNPSNGIFTIQSLVSNYQWSVEVYNVLGEQVYSNYQITKSSNYQINISSQPKGIYFYRALTKEGILISSGKLVID